MGYCEVCGKEATSDRAKYCGNACRQKAHRQRKAQKAELAPPAKLQGLRPMVEAAPDADNSAIIAQLIDLNKTLVEQIKAQQAMIRQQQQVIENNTAALKALQEKGASLSDGNFTSRPASTSLQKPLPGGMLQYEDDAIDPAQLVSVKKVKTEKDNSSQNFMNSLMALQS